MKMKLLDGTMSDCIEDIKDVVAETNKMVLTKRDISKLRNIRKRLAHMQRQLSELETFVSVRLRYAIGGTDAGSNRPKAGDRLAELPKE